MMIMAAAMMAKSPATIHAVFVRPARRNVGEILTPG
jgi:hypothetical protein